MIRRAIGIVLSVLGLAIIAGAQTPKPGMFGNVAGFTFPTGFGFAYKGVAYSQAVAPTNAPLGSTLTWSVSSGSLPAGLALTTSSNNGVVSGTPTGSGASSFTLQWTTGGANPTVATSGIVAITVNTLSTVAVTPTGQSISVSATLQMRAGCTWTPTPGTNPPCPVAWTGSGSPAGSFSSIGSTTGLLTAGASAGTVTTTATSTSATGSVVGSTTVTVTTTAPSITNASPLTCSGHQAQINIVCPPITLTASGGTAPYTFAIVSGAPPGCTITSPVLNCTPTSSGTFSSFVIRVTDNVSATSTKTFSMTVASLSSIALTPSSVSLLQGASQQMTATGTFSDSSTADVTTLVIGTSGSPSVTVCAPVGTSGSATSVTVPCTVASGSAVYFICESNTGGTTPGLPTDTASQTWPAADGLVNDFNSSLSVWHFTNSAALTSVTCHASASIGILTAAAVVVSGAATSSLIDGTTVTASSGTASGGVTGLTSPQFNTTNASDIIFVGLKAAAQASWTPSSGYTISTLFNNTRLAVATAIVTGTQTNITPSITWAGTSFAGLITDAFKGAAAGGTGWSTTSGGGVATVNGTGLVHGQNQGSDTVKACIGATCGTAPVTVTGSGTDTSLVISPSSGSTSVGSTIQFNAVGNVTNNNYNNPPTVWGAQ